MNKYKKTYILDTWQFFLYIFFVFIFIFLLMYRFRDESTLILGASGIIAGLLGVFQKQIVSVCYRPRLLIDIVALPIPGGIQYDLLIKNIGAIAKNLQLKIRNGKDKEWVNLKIPFGDLKNCNSTMIKTISNGEEVFFNIFRTSTNNQDEKTYCHLEPDIRPYNQIFFFVSGENHKFLLEMTSDDIKPINFSIIIGENIDRAADKDIVKITNLNKVI